MYSRGLTGTLETLNSMLLNHWLAWPKRLPMERAKPKCPRPGWPKYVTKHHTFVGNFAYSTLCICRTDGNSVTVTTLSKGILGMQQLRNDYSLTFP